MSVDTTILILKKENNFYVATRGAVENITEHRDEECINDHIATASNASRVTDDLNKALAFAEVCENEHMEIMGYKSEYGIRVFSL